jgi:ribosome-associated translation inhibitor RaiA
MRLQIYQKNYELSEEQTTYIQKRIMKPFDTFLESLNDEIKTGRLSVSGHDDGSITMSLDMNLPGKHHFYVESTKYDFNGVVADLKDKIKNQIAHYRSEYKNR